MNELGILYLGCDLLSDMDMPYEIDKCLECLNQIDQFSLDLKKDSELRFCDDVKLNRLAIRTDAIEVAADEMEHLAELEFRYYGGNDAGKVISALLKYRITGRDAMKPLSGLLNSEGFKKYVLYWTEISSIPTFSEIFGLWHENPNVLQYLSYELKEELRKKCDDIFRRFRMESLSIAALKYLVNSVFVSFGSGSEREQVIKNIKEYVNLFKKYDVPINDLQYVDWAIIQCYGGDSCAKKD